MGPKAAGCNVALDNVGLALKSAPLPDVREARRGHDQLPMKFVRKVNECNRKTSQRLG